MNFIIRKLKVKIACLVLLCVFQIVFPSLFKLLINLPLSYGKGKLDIEISDGRCVYMIEAYAAETVSGTGIVPAIRLMPTGIYRETLDYLEINGSRITVPPILQGYHARITNITDDGLEIVNYNGEGEDIGHILYTKIDDRIYQSVSELLTWTLILHPEERCYETQYRFTGQNFVAADVFTCGIEDVQ